MLQFKKSREPDFSNYNIKHKLDLLLKEQVQQRLDLANINALLKSLMADSGVQKQVDDFYGQSPQDMAEEIEETSPQTDLEDK